MSLFLRDLPEEMADIASKVAKLFYPKNRDPALEYEDYLHEILIELSKECSGKSSDPAWMYSIAKNTAIDLLRVGNRRAHLSLNKPVVDDEGNTVEWGDLKLIKILREQATQELEELLLRVGLEQSTPSHFRELVYKRIAGYPLTAAERQRLSRIKRKIDVTIWEELFDTR